MPSEAPDDGGMSRSLIIDCDPGVDDAVALFLALGAPELDVLAVTTVAGNVGLDLTTRNARLIVERAGRGDIPVHAGCDRPLVRAPVEAGEFHGASGLGDWAVAEPARPPAPGHAVQALIDLVMARPEGSVDLAILGPMTNVALAMRLEPRLAGRLGRIAVMGGARSAGGNITASAEYNIFADPHAAAVVLGSGAEVIVFGLDVTHAVLATPERIEMIRATSGDAAAATADLLDFSARIERAAVGRAGAPMHDPCPIAWLIRPELFELRPARIAVETTSPLTLGATAVEFRLGQGEAPSTRWAVAADAQRVFDLLATSLERLP